MAGAVWVLLQSLPIAKWRWPWQMTKSGWLKKSFFTGSWAKSKVVESAMWTEDRICIETLLCPQRCKEGIWEETVVLWRHDSGGRWKAAWRHCKSRRVWFLNCCCCCWCCGWYISNKFVCLNDKPGHFSSDTLPKTMGWKSWLWVFLLFLQITFFSFFENYLFSFSLSASFFWVESVFPVSKSNLLCLCINKNLWTIFKAF